MRATCCLFFCLWLSSSYGMDGTNGVDETIDLSNIPAEVFARLPIGGYRLSPSGTKIAHFIPFEGRRVLVIQNMDGSNRQFVPPWDEEIELVSFFWKSDDVIIFKIHMTLDRQIFRKKTTETRLFSYNVADPLVRWLGQPKKAAFGKGSEKFNSQYERVVDRLSHDPEHMLVELDFELQGDATVYKVNVNTGGRQKYQSTRKGINQWYADANSIIRFGTGYKPRTSQRRFLYKDLDDSWTEINPEQFNGKYTFEGIGPESGQLYVTATNEYGTSSMLLVNILTAEVVETLFSHPEVDIDFAITHPETDAVIGVGFTDDFRREQYFDKDFRPLQRGLEKALPGQVVSITNKARDAALYLIHAESDTDPGQYFLYNRDTKRLDYFAEARAEIDPQKSAPTKRVNIPTSDGAIIPGYLTLPRNGSGKNLPMIVLPHGGPGARDSAAWNYNAQFFASRGYAVLKPNFRGSTGYGKRFKKLGENQWGGLMQQDVTDATQWLINEGIADPERICLVGSSYGGYAALMGLIQQPDLYACGVSVNGVINLPQLKAVDRDSIGGRSWIKQMGLQGANDKDVSPQHQAKRIMSPVLLIASTNDARISYRQTERLHDKLKKLDKDSTYVELDTGTHYMLNSESRLAALSAMEVFLAKHLTPPSSAPVEGQ